MGDYEGEAKAGIFASRTRARGGRRAERVSGGAPGQPHTCKGWTIGRHGELDRPDDTRNAPVTGPADRAIDRPPRHRAGANLFPRSERVTRKADFRRVFERKCSAADGLLIVYADANGLAWSRLGLAVGRRVGGAVVRNRVKRRLREAFRAHKADLPIGLDIICVPRPVAVDDSADLGRCLIRLTHRAAKNLARCPSPPC